jgi:N-acetylneuraminic acid mutarotase
MKKTIATLILCLVLNYPLFAQKLWDQKTNHPGNQRNNATGFSINGKGYIGLGQNPSGSKFTDFYEYDPSTNKWTQKANYTGPGISGCTGFSANGKGYVCFGVNSSGVNQKELWEYTPNSNSWTQKATFPGTARYHAGCFVINDTAFIIGGNPGGSPYLSDVWMYVPATNTWTQKANFGGGNRAGGTGFTVNGVGYFGTGITSATSPQKDVWKYNKSKDTWSSIANLPSAACSGAIGFGIGLKGYLGTGYDVTNFLKDIYEYDPKANTWKKTDSIPSSQSVRGFSVSFVIGGSAYFGTGYGTAVSNSLNDFWSLTPKIQCVAYFLTDPYNQSVNLNDTAKFSALSNDTSATYKWQMNAGTGFKDLSDGGQYSGSKTKKLSLSNVKYATNNNLKFRCIATGKTCSDSSSSATLTVICPTIIKTYPTNQTGNNGTNVKFNISAIYSGTTYQWQKDDGTGFKDINNGGQFAGVDNDTLSINDLLYSNNGLKVRCNASYDGCTSTSSIVLLTVTCKSIIKNQPSNTTVVTGNLASISLNVFDAGTTFQWKTKIGTSFQNLINAGQYYGVTSDSLKISPADISNKNQQFKCLVNYKGCKDSSKIVTLDVLCKPLVSTQPQNQNKTEGEKALFTTSSSETNTSFLWQINGGTGYQNLNNSGSINGATNDSLTISNLTLADNNRLYRCILSSGGCFDTTKNATLLVRCKTILNTQPKNVKAFVSNNAILSFSSFEANATFAWQSDVGFGYQNLSNAGQYNGVNNDSLIISNVSLSNNNQKFRCILTLGNCTETTEIATLQVICNTIIDRQPVNKTAAISGSTFLNVSAFDSKATYRWQSDVGFGYQNLSNAGQYRGVNNDTLIINDLTASNNNQTFRCIINTGACGDTTDIASITVKSAGITPHEHGEISVFPNPSNGFIQLKINPNLLNNNFKIIDQQGRLIMEGKLTETNTKISIEHLANGIYILRTEPTLTHSLIIKN